MSHADLQVGYAAATLDVPPGTPLGGYQPTRDSTATHDPLEVGALVVDDGDHRLSLVLVDLVCVNRDLAEAVRVAINAGVDQPVEVWVGASHTHSGPDVGSRPGGGRTPERWLAEVSRLGADCHREAVARLVPSEIRQASVSLDGIGSVRADPGAPHRVAADLLHWPGAPGVLAVVPVHSTVLPQSSTLVSGDLHGAVRRHLRASFDGWVVVVPGCAGDISTRWTRRAQDHAECDRLGGAVAEQLRTALPTTRRVADEHASLGPVAGAHLTLLGRVDDPERLTHGVSPTTDPAATDSGRARVEETRRQGVDLALARAAEPLESVELHLASARIGDLLLAAIGAEPYLGLRDRLRRATGATAVTLGYTGGYAGYLPDAAAHDDPCYEVLASPFRPEAEEQVLAALTELATEAAPTTCPAKTTTRPAKENHP